MKKAGDNTAYVAARYNPNYEIRQDQVMLLFDRVNNSYTNRAIL